MGGGRKGEREKRKSKKSRKEKGRVGEIESGEFAEQILKELIDEGYSGYELLDEFSVRQSKVRSAVEAILEEAKNGSITNFVDLWFLIYSLLLSSLIFRKK